MRKGRMLAAGLLVVLTLGAAACSSESKAGGHDVSSTTEPAGGGGSARITRLELPESTTCANVTYTTVDVRYATEGAVRVELRADGRDVPIDDPASGTVKVDIRCDPLPHDFVLFAYDAAGKYTTEKKNVEVK